MKVRLLTLWEALRTNYWFLPGLMIVGAGLLAWGTNSLDRLLSDAEVRSFQWVWIGSPEAARSILSTIASSMITVAGVIFSITIVALVQASTQFGPRLLRTFMRDAGNQTVLGTFVATFMFCLLTLRSVHSAPDNYFVPHVSVTMGLALSIASLVVLVYYIHHVCDMIHAENLVAQVGRELLAEIKESFRDANSDEQQAKIPARAGGSSLVTATQTGYVQAVDTEAIARVAKENDVWVEVLDHPGNFVAEATPVLSYTPAKALSEEARECLSSALIVARHRTPTQDPEYAVNQLVEIAVRALSPGVNDPFTAVSCVDWLGAALVQVAQRKAPVEVIKDGDNTPRVLLPSTSFVKMLNVAFNQIRQHGARDVAVSIRLLETLARIHRAVPAEAERDREAVIVCAKAVARDATRSIPNPTDRRIIKMRLKQVISSGAQGLHAKPYSSSGNE